MKKILNRNIRRLVILVALIIIAPPGRAFDSEHLTAFTKRGMEMWHVPGMSVAVVTKDKILFQQGFGETAVDQGRAVDEHTLFAIASTTKAMVAAGILMLVDEQLLSLDDPVTRYIPELHFKDPMLTQQVTVRDLLTHRTGLPGTDFWMVFQNMPLEEQISRLQYVPSQAPVRSRFIYQNTMVEIAGLLFERLGGRPWQEFLTERLWRPIGMLETYGDRAQKGAGQIRVTPYLYHDNRLTVANWDFPADHASAAGSAWSSIHDMSLWAQFLLNDGVTSNGDRLISEAGMAQMFEPQQLASPADFYPTAELTESNWRSYGLAWFQQDFQGRKIDYHTGSLSGLFAILGLDREAGMAVIALGNRDHAEMRQALMWDVFDNTRGDEHRDWNQAVFDLYAAQEEEDAKSWQQTLQKRIKRTRPSLKQAAYEGRYSNPVFGDITIAGSGAYLVLRTARIDLAMRHWHLDSFLVEYKNWNMREFATFNIDPSGSITTLKLFGEIFERVPAN